MEEFDIFNLFNQSKQSIVKNISTMQAKIELLDELNDFFKTNNLKVFKVSEAKAEEPAAEENK